MAEKTEEHKQLIKEANGLGITSAHMFTMENLQKKVDEVKNSNGSPPPSEQNTPDGTGDDDDAGLGSDEEVSADHAICLYHKTEQPRVFEAGENIPKGWNIENRKYWTVTDNGKFVNVND